MSKRDYKHVALTGSCNSDLEGFLGVSTHTIT